MHTKVARALEALKNKERARISQRFFKTGKGEYGEGDVFLGIPVPELRRVAKQYKDMSLDEVEMLLSSRIHEERFVALVIMTHRFEKGDANTRKTVFDRYLSNREHINNWDLVDVSAPRIVGAYLFNRKDKKILYDFAWTGTLWEKRIAMLSTLHFIVNKDHADALKIAEILLHEDHDLLHKAVGWMLREVGNRSIETEKAFLKKHYQAMPRTMLRYAIEKFPEPERQAYLKGLV
jgi:3-methyladenine DNA glycosylase AlkD